MVVDDVGDDWKFVNHAYIFANDRPSSAQRKPKGGRKITSSAGECAEIKSEKVLKVEPLFREEAEEAIEEKNA